MTVRNTAFDRGRAISLGGASSLGVLLVLGGCAVGPTFKPPQATVNESWRASGDPRVSTQTTADSSWWRAFGDSTLDRLVELAYRQNLPLQIAGLRIVEARAQLAVVTGLQFPQTQLATGSATAIGLSKNVVNIPNLPRNFGIYQVGFDAAWELDFWGKYRRGVEAEAATLLGSVASYESALVSLTAEVARTYVVVRTFEVLIAQTEENARVQEQALEIAQSRFRNGATSELDPTQATTPAAEHPGLDPPARDRARAGSERPQHHPRTTARDGRSVAGRAQGDPEGARQGLRRRPGRDAAAAPGHSWRRASRRRAVRPDRRRQGRSLSELFDPRQHRLSGQHRPDGVAQSLHPERAGLLRRPADQLALPQLRPPDERRARRGRAVSGAAGQLPRHRAQGRSRGGGRLDRVHQRRGDDGARAGGRRGSRTLGGDLPGAVPRRRGRLPAGAGRGALSPATAEQSRRDELSNRDQRDRPLQGARWRVGGAPGRTGGPRGNAARDEGANQLGRSAVAAARALKRPRTKRRNTREPDMAEDLEACSQVDRRVARRRGRRVHRRSLLASSDTTRCPRGSSRATAGSRRSSSTWPPRSRSGSRRSSSTRAPSSSLDKCWHGSTP